MYLQLYENNPNGLLRSSNQTKLEKDQLQVITHSMSRFDDFRTAPYIIMHIVFVQYLPVQGSLQNDRLPRIQVQILCQLQQLVKCQS